MKDDNDKNKKSRAADIIRMIRERQAQKEQPEESIRDIINLKRQEREKEEWEETFNDWLASMPTPPEGMNANSGLGGGRTRTSDEPFHEFKEIKPAMNALGLYMDIMEDIEFENDPKALKKFFSESLQHILENVDDTDAFIISRKMKGIE